MKKVQDQVDIGFQLSGISFCWIRPMNDSVHSRCAIAWCLRVYGYCSLTGTRVGYKFVVNPLFGKFKKTLLSKWLLSLQTRAPARVAGVPCCRFQIQKHKAVGVWPPNEVFGGVGGRNRTYHMFQGLNLKLKISSQYTVQELWWALHLGYGSRNVWQFWAQICGSIYVSAHFQWEASP